MEYKTYDKPLYSYSNSHVCGVLMTEKVMKKLVKLQARQMEEVRSLLSQEENNVFPYMWTLHYPDGKQTHVTFIDEESSLERGIENATSLNQPKYHKTVFIAHGMDEAEKMADKRYEDIRQKGD